MKAPNANAYAECWVRTVREECLDHFLIMNETHLHRVLKSYVTYYETARPHQGLAQQMPIPPTASTKQGAIHKRELFGGIINDYYRTAHNISSHDLLLKSRA